MNMDTPREEPMSESLDAFVAARRAVIATQAREVAARAMSELQASGQAIAPGTESLIVERIEKMLFARLAEDQANIAQRMAEGQ